MDLETFRELYERLVKASWENRLQEEVDQIKNYEEYNEHHLECLLNPEKEACVIKVGECGGCGNDTPACEASCLFSAVKRDESGKLVIDTEHCVGCLNCVDACKSKALADRKDILPVLEQLKLHKAPIYAMIAPAFNGQFSMDVTAGKLRTAFKKLGFDGMVEVALFADILTLKEALEFDKSINDDKDFVLTSCCCPIWVAMIKNIYNDLIPHMPPSVSPMVACGRSIKHIRPDAITVFIGPCIAKKAEAREPDIRDAVDFVLTFQEIDDLFKLANINPADMPEDERDHSSTAGRIYARTGGVSRAVQTTLDRLSPNRRIPLRSTQANGAKECKQLLKEISEGKINANFIEGMGCVGGCVGGPKAIIPRDEGTVHVDEYGSSATFKTPIDNPHVIHLLNELGFETVSDLLERDNIFIRRFSKS